MSKPLRVGLVTEGPTDYPILVAALEALFGEVQATPLQPPLDSIGAMPAGGAAGDHGGGWKGVRSWCQAARGNGQWEIALGRNALVVIHVDADVAGEGEIGVEQPCPPASASVDGLIPVVAGWIGEPLEDKCVLCVPSKASDAWLIVALGLAPDGIECEPNPAAFLRAIKEKPKPVTGHAPDKHSAGYRRLAPAVRERWAQVKCACSEALRFEQAVLSAVPPAPAGAAP